MKPAPREGSDSSDADRKTVVGTWYDAYIDRLFAYGCSLTHDNSEVKDAIHEVFCGLMQREESLGEIKNPKSFLLIALRNVIRKSIIQRKNRRRLLQVHAHGLPRQTAPEDHFVKENPALKAGIRQLPARQREILYLRYYEELDYAEIMRITGLEYQVVRNYAYRAIRRLRKELAQTQRYPV